jgi:hypothetical protein
VLVELYTVVFVGYADCDETRAARDATESSDKEVLIFSVWVIVMRSGDVRAEGGD